MIILGITDGDRPAAAVVRDARLVATARAPADPDGQPWRAVRRALATADCSLDQVGRVVFSSHVAPPPRLEGLGRVHPALSPTPRAERWLRRGTHLLRDMTLEETGLWTVASSLRRGRQTDRLRDSGYRGDVKTFDHYRSLSHAAWRCQPYERILVIAASTDGDGTTLAVSVGDHDGLRLLYRQGGLSSLREHVAAAADDPVPWRAAATLAERARDSEPPEELEERFARWLHFSGGGFNLALRSGSRLLAREALRHTPGEVAAACQLNLEHQFRRLAHHWVRRSGVRRLTVAGDVFANAGLCRALLAHDDVDDLFVLPCAVPEAAAAGAAMRYGDAGPRPLSSPHLGPALDEAACLAAATELGLYPEQVGDMVTPLANHLVAGGTVVRLAGRAALGNRSLGHRSVLVRADAPAASGRWLDRLSLVARASHTLVTTNAVADRDFPELGEVREASRFGAVPLRPSKALRKRCPGLDGKPVRVHRVAEHDDPALARLLEGLESRGAAPVLSCADLDEGGGLDDPGALVDAAVATGAVQVQLGSWLATNGVRGGPATG